MNDFRTASTLSPSTKVVESVAEELDVDPVELETPLCEVIDTDALDDFFKNQDHSVVVSFSHYGYRIVVQDDGHVTLTEEE
jgi:hypothetical protein